MIKCYINLKKANVIDFSASYIDNSTNKTSDPVTLGELPILCFTLEISTLYIPEKGTATFIGTF